MRIAHVQIGVMQRCILLLILWTASIAQLAAQWTASPEERQAKALKVVATVDDYRHLITQHAKTSEAPGPGEFTDWLLNEINCPSMLRDQIAEDIDAIESNGRNTNFLDSYLTTNGELLQRLEFGKDNLKIRRIGGEKEVFTYQASFFAKNYFHRGVTKIEFVFTFQVKVEPFVYTKAHQVEVISYPKFVKKNEKEETWQPVK